MIKASTPKYFTSSNKTKRGVSEWGTFAFHFEIHSTYYQQ